MTVETWIAKMAEEVYPIGGNFAKLHQAAYSAGAKDMKEHLGGFAEWLQYQGFNRNNENEFWDNQTSEDYFPMGEKKPPLYFTTDQLIELYFEQLNAKK